MHSALSSFAALHALAGAVAGAAGSVKWVLHRGGSLHLFSSWGLLGLFVIAIVNSTFVPLPIPGIADILVILYAANHVNPIFVVVIATVGSAIGGFTSHAAGSMGGMPFLRKYISERTLNRITSWVVSHPILTVALPAILPPPMPLWPFILVAGAVHMSRREFMWSFTVSRFLRHAITAWLGIRYGSHVLHVWAHFNARWANTILIAVWSTLGISVIFALWKLYQASREFRSPPPATIR
ncbi:MAG: YqaA family protein [Acidobacteriaceae bacterium]